MSHLYNTYFSHKAAAGTQTNYPHKKYVLAAPARIPAEASSGKSRNASKYNARYADDVPAPIQILSLSEKPRGTASPSYASPQLYHKQNC